MGNQEIDWMLEHWRSLTCIQGNFNKQDRELDGSLRDHGLVVTGDPDYDYPEEFQRRKKRNSPPPRRRKRRNRKVPLKLLVIATLTTLR
jgi:hypothetical protein